MPKTLIVQTANADETRTLAARLGARLAGGEVIALHGDLGAGKTTFVQGMLQGMGSRDRVTSPTFTLVNVYQTARAIEVHHVDAYRLGSFAADVNADLELDAESLALDDVLGARNVVVIIEWAGRVASLHRNATLSITLSAADAEISAETASGTEPAADRRTIAMQSMDTHGDVLLDRLNEPLAASSSS